MNKTLNPASESLSPARADMASAAAISARDRILLTAHDLFYRDGIRATGIDRIIADAKVTKVTFYRHFPSKHDLILAFLNVRHDYWMAWFSDAIQRHSVQQQGLGVLVPVMQEWFSSTDFRGCAFLNSVGELGGTMPEVMTITRQHKRDMEQRIAPLLPTTLAPLPRMALASAAALAIDGAIIRAQFDEEPKAALAGLAVMLEALGLTGS